MKNSLVLHILAATLLLISCSDVQLTYGVGGNGLTTVSDRNRNASTPANLEELTGSKLPTPAPSPTPRGERDGQGTPQGTTSPQPQPSPSGSKPGTRYEGELKLHLLPDGPIFLLGSGDSQSFQVVLKDAEGNVIDPSRFGGIVVQAENGELVEVTSNTIEALVNKGETKLIVFLRDEPSVRTEVEVHIGTDASGISSSDGDFHLRIIPSGPIYLDGFGDEQSLQVLLETLTGQSVDLAQHPLVWELADDSKASINGNRVISRVDEGATTLKISLRDDPDTWVLIDVIIRDESPSGGGGGGGGGNGGQDDNNPPGPTPPPKDNVTGTVIFE